MLITLTQQDLENTGDECAPCTKAAGSKGTKGRAQLQAGDKWQARGVYGRFGAREELNRRADTSTYVKDRGSSQEGPAVSNQGPQCPAKGTNGASTAPRCGGKPFTYTKQASGRAHTEQRQTLITLNQQHLEHTGDECAPCTRAAKPKGTKTRALLQTAGKRHTNTKRASARAHKTQR